jgi:heme-degrading monooxygenase HmoA
MFVRVWEYDVVPASAEEFQRAYGSAGAWAQLFRRADGFVGTELFRSGLTTTQRELAP